MFFPPSSWRPFASAFKTTSISPSMHFTRTFVDSLSMLSILLSPGKWSTANLVALRQCHRTVAEATVLVNLEILAVKGAARADQRRRKGRILLHWQRRLTRRQNANLHILRCQTARGRRCATTGRSAPSPSLRSMLNERSWRKSGSCRLRSGLRMGH